MRLVLAALLAALAGPASAAVRAAPLLPPKFMGGAPASAWKAWEKPLAGLYADNAKPQLTPAIAAIVGGLRPDARSSELPQPSVIALLTAQLEESGVTPVDFAALAPEKKAERVVAAFADLEAQLKAQVKTLGEKAVAAEQARDAEGLRRAREALGLVLTLHRAYLDPMTAAVATAARNRAYAAAVDQGVADGVAAMGAARDAESMSREEIFAVRDPWRSYDDPRKKAREEFLPKDGQRDWRPLPGFTEEFVAHMGRHPDDVHAPFEAVRGLKDALTDATASEQGEALETLAWIGKNSKVERARFLAVEALGRARFRELHEADRLKAVRDIGVADESRLVKKAALESLRGHPDELAAVEKSWRRQIGGAPPTPKIAKDPEAVKKANKMILNGVTGVIGGAAGVWFMGGEIPSWLAWMGAFAAWLPWIGIATSGVMLLVGLYKRFS